MPEEILETPQPIQPVETKSSDWTKIILAAVVGLGLLAGSAYAGYYYGTQETSNLKNQISNPQPKTQIPETPTPEPTPAPVTNPTVDWETFTNSYQKYSVRIPLGWDAKIYSEHLKEQSWTYLSKTESYPISIGVENTTLLKEEGKTFKESAEYWRDYYMYSTSELVDLDPFVESEDAVTVGSKVGIRYNIAYRKGNGQSVWVYLPTDGNYILKIQVNNADDALLKQFNQILSTFKFLE